VRITKPDSAIDPSVACLNLTFFDLSENWHRNSSHKNLQQGSAFLAHFGSFGSFFNGMPLFIVGGDFFVLKIIRETTEIQVFFSNLIKLSMKFGFS
jgi:hypothetical protein